ncbi:MAG: ABC transporter substrate-binding protein [Deltaproteobacteria bacterium]|nr:ABC transporter substrate-binding protein [Deltaproteobacteria bacterium]
MKSVATKAVILILLAVSGYILFAPARGVSEDALPASEPAIAAEADPALVLPAGAEPVAETPVAADIAAETDEIVIGLNIPLKGPYKEQGEDQKKAYELAVDMINKGGGLLGKKVKAVIMDTENNPQLAQQNTLKMIWEHNACMISGGSSSAEAVAIADECQKQGVVFMTGLTHANDTTGHTVTPAGFTVQTARRHTFRWFLNAWMSANALAPYLVEEFGKSSSYVYITADYNWGHSVEESMRRFLEIKGADTYDAIPVPLGTKDYTEQLKQAKKLDPDILVLVLFGADQVAALKQADEMGLDSKMQIVVPIVDMYMAHEVGAKAFRGVISTAIWDWTLEDTFAGTKKFVEAFRAKYNRPPGVSAACAWVAINQWAEAVKRAQDPFADDKIIHALEGAQEGGKGHKFTLLKGEEQWRNWDHQCISSVYIIRGKNPKKAKSEWDFFELVSEVPGLKVIQTREENPVSLDPLVIEE